MDGLYFIGVGIVLYLVSDWILQRAEAAIGRRLEHRSLVFFGILLGLALASFAAIRHLGGG